MPDMLVALYGLPGFPRGQERSAAAGLCCRRPHTYERSARAVRIPGSEPGIYGDRLHAQPR